MEEKIVDRDRIAAIVAEARRGGKTIAFTSGVFDILHRGHVTYLEHASREADVLIVGVNSDSSVSALKGPERPIVPERDRATIVAALQCVDYVFVFDELNNQRNVELIRPDCYVKAGDYQRERLGSAPFVESYGGRVALVPFEEGRSSSSIISQIRSAPRADAAPRRALRRAVFLDRDGTINQEIEYLHEPEKFVLCDGVIPALQQITKAGFVLVVVTNQAGIGLGYFSKEDFFRVNRRMLSEFGAAGIAVEAVYYCPHRISDGCDCRKPKPGMLLRAAREVGIDLTESFMIGDSVVDIEAARSAGVRPVLIESERTRGGSAGALGCRVVPNLLAAVTYIEGSRNE